MKTASILGLLCFTSLAYAVDYTETRQLSADVGNGIEVLEIEAGAGSLTITGKDQKTIEVKAEIVLDETGRLSQQQAKDYLKKHLHLTLDNLSSKTKLVAKFETPLFGRVDQALINLQITVPQNLMLDIDDGSGEIYIQQHKASVKIDDGSGAITVKDINDSVSIIDGSGSITVTQISGNLSIDDGSGSVDLSDVSGDIHVEDGSGTITINRVGGNVKVDDGSGGIEVNDVKKDFILISDGSGSLDIHDIQGKTVINKD